MLWKQLLLRNVVVCPRLLTRTQPPNHLCNVKTSLFSCLANDHSKLTPSPSRRTSLFCSTTLQVRSFHATSAARRTIPRNPQGNASDVSNRIETADGRQSNTSKKSETETNASLPEKTLSDSQGEPPASFTSPLENVSPEVTAWRYPQNQSSDVSDVEKENLKVSGTEDSSPENSGAALHMTNNGQDRPGNFPDKPSSKKAHIDTAMPPNTRPGPPADHYPPLYAYTLPNIYNSTSPGPLQSPPNHNPSQTSLRPSNILHSYPYPYHIFLHIPPGTSQALPLPVPALTAPEIPPPTPPHSPPPPNSRAALLVSTKGFLPRIRLRIKLLLMKQIRPWTVDDFMAMFSWLFVANGLYIILGTTSFVSAVLWVINSLQFQEFAARRVGNFLTKQTGLTVTFESAIVPNWKDGKISLKNVALKRGPSTPGAANSTSTAQLATDAMVAQSVAEKNNNGADVNGSAKTDDYMYVDLTVEQIDVTLDVRRWLDGKGILRDANIRGVRGIIDRSHITYDPSAPVWPNREGQPGDLQLESFVMEDLLLTVYQVGNFRPYTISIFNADVPHGLRIQWLLYDLLCAESVVGMFDQCLFSLHTPQKESMTAEEERKLMGSGRMSRLKIDGVPIDHLNAGVEGPFGWITSGTVDISANVLIPQEPREDIMRQIVHEIVDKIDEIAISAKSVPYGDDHDDTAADQQPNHAPSNETAREGNQDGFFLNVFGEGEPLKKRRGRLRKSWEGVKEELMKGEVRDAGRPAFVMNFDIRLNNLKASIPIGNPDLTYLSSALVRSVVAYMNANRTTLPVTAVIRLDLENFNGAWTIYQCGLANALSEEIGRAVVMMASNERERHRRLKRVGLWGLQLGTRNLIAVWEYVRGHSEFWANVGSTVVKAGASGTRMAATSGMRDTH